MVAYDVRGLTLMADSFFICTANSEPQLKALFNTIKEGMKEVGVAPLHTEGVFQGGWLLIDFSEVIVHIFREEAREFYDLDGMWADAKRIPLDVDDKSNE
jgi:ribosome-associated protein